MRRLLAPSRPDPLALALLALAALCVLVAGFQHARLFHRGYAEVEIVGLLFFMNAIGSTVVVLMLSSGASGCSSSAPCRSACRRSSRSRSRTRSGFLGFREGGYDGDALVIVVAEVAAVGFALAGGAMAASGPARAGGRMRLVLAALVVVVMAFAITGIGMGEAPAERQAAPSADAVAAAKQRIAAGGAAAARGRALFEDEGCDRCHAIAATGADGQLGPRLDAIDDDADDVAEAIVEPREDIVDGFPERLMPDDYGRPPQRHRGRRPGGLRRHRRRRRSRR